MVLLRCKALPKLQKDNKRNRLTVTAAADRGVGSDIPLAVEASAHAYSLRLIRISHVYIYIWVQAANCEMGEITTWSRLQNHRNKDLDTEMFAKYDLEPFQHRTMNLLYEFGMCFLETRLIY